MGKDIVPVSPPASDQLHPLVYKTAAGLVFCFVIAAWMFFDRQSDIAELLGFASGLLFVAVALPTLLWRVWRAQQDVQPEERVIPFRRWASGDFDIWGSRLKARHAAVDALLPLAAVAFGMIGIGIVFAMVAAGAGPA